MTRQPPAGNDNANWGRTAETAACERFGLERVSGDPDEPWWFDARACEEIAPEDGFGRVEPGTPVEVKSAAWRIDANGGDRRGRWLLRERSHRRLLDNSGEYVFAVVAPGEGGVVGLVMRPAWWVDALVTTWSPSRARRSSRRVAQIPWSRVFCESEGEGETKVIAPSGLSSSGVSA